MLAHVVADVVVPAVAVGSCRIVSVNVVDDGAHMPPSLTVIVKVTVAPDAISAALKL